MTETNEQTEVHCRGNYKSRSFCHSTELARDSASMPMASKLTFLQPILTSSRPVESQRSHSSCSRQNRLLTSTKPRIRINSNPQHQSSASYLSDSRTNTFLSPQLPHPSNRTRSVTARSQLPNFPLISPHDKWGTWTALFATGAFGIW